MPPEYPLLDLKHAWRDAHAYLTEAREQAEELYHASEATWTEMAVIMQQVDRARAALGDLPPGILEGIAKEEADLQEWEDKIG